MVGKKRHSRWFTRWGGASKIDCSASMPQGLTSQSCLKDQLPQNIFLWFKKEVQYIICNDWIKRKLRHDASVPSIYIYLTGWNKARCKIVRTFLVTLASASGISRSQVRGLCLASTRGCILSSTGADDANGSESRDTDAGGESIATQRSGAKRSWDYGMWSAWTKIGDFSSCFFFCLISLSNYLELVQEILWFVLVCENAQIAPDQLQMCFIRRCWWTLNYIWYLVVPEVKDVQTLTANHKRGAQKRLW